MRRPTGKDICDEGARAEIETDVQLRAAHRRGCAILVTFVDGRFAGATEIRWPIEKSARGSISLEPSV